MGRVKVGQSTEEGEKEEREMEGRETVRQTDRDRKCVTEDAFLTF